MAVTDLTQIWLGSLAVLATLGLFYQFRDAWTGVLVEIVATVLWAVFAVVSMNVVVGPAASPPVSEPNMPLVYLGLGFAVLTLLFGINDLLDVLRGDAADVDAGEVGAQ